MQTVTTFKPVSADNVASFRKEASFYKSMILIDTYNKKTVLEVRFYGKNASYCCTWLAYGYGPNGESARAGARAVGGGYHRESAAMAYALEAMGFRFSQDFSGCGDGAMHQALEAIANHLGLAGHMIVMAHA